MSSNTTLRVRRIIENMLTAAFILFAAGVAYGRGPDDTVDGLMAAAKAAQAQSSGLLRTVHEAHVLSSRLSTDRAFASRLLTSVSKNDTAGINALLREAMPNCDATVGKTAADFNFFVHDIHIPGTHYTCSVCISTTNECAPDKTSCTGTFR